MERFLVRSSSEDDDDKFFKLVEDDNELGNGKQNIN